MPAQLQHYPTLAAYLAANRRTRSEHDDELLPLLEGELPAGLVGTLLRNGNGHFEQHGVPYEHLFDGDGMVARFHFDGSAVRYRNRYVRTREFVAEEAAGQLLHRSFGTNLPGGLRRNFGKMQFKNAANTSLVRHGGQLLALWEGGLPHALDPDTLATQGRYDYGGVLLNKFSWLDRRITPEMPFSAHPKIHPTTGVLHNFGTVAGTRHRLALYEVAPNGQARIAQAIEMPEATFAHDFVLTASGHQVFFLTPVAFDVWRAFSGLASPAASLKISRSQPTQVLVVAPDGTVSRLHTDFCFVFHFVNGYQDADGTLVADALVMDDFPDSLSIRAYLRGELPPDARQARFTRFQLDVAAGTVRRAALGEHEGELPEINPDYLGRPYRYAWSIGRPPGHPLPLLDHLLKLDVRTGQATVAYQENTLCSEPVIVPRPHATAEDDAWLLYLRYDATADATDLLVADAASLATLARLRLPQNIPLGFHGLWISELVS